MNTEITELKARLNRLIETESICYSGTGPQGDGAQDAFDSGMRQLQEEIDDLREEIREREERRGDMKEDVTPTTGSPVYTNEFYVAGVKFHQFHTIKDILEEGMTVDLIPEPSNKYDKFAMKIKHNNVMLGYVPKKSSQEVADLVNSGTELEATITQLQPDFEPWTALRVEIREVQEASNLMGMEDVEDVQDG